MSVELPATPGLSEEEMAAVVIAVATLGARRGVASAPEVTTPPWRFSGRWFTGPRTRA